MVTNDKSLHKVKILCSVNDNFPNLCPDVHPKRETDVEVPEKGIFLEFY